MLLAGSNTKAINVLSHVIMMTANPLSLVAITVFLWQQIRYLMFRQLYYFMSVSTDLKIFTKICRIVVSKIAYTVLVIVVAIFVLAFYGGFTGGVHKSPSYNYKNLSIGRAISYFGMLLFVAIFIIVTLVIDVLTSINKFKSVEENLDIASGETVYTKPRIWKQLLNHVTRDDALLFRIDALLLSLMILALFVYYGISIGYLLNEGSIALGIVQQIFETIFILLKIAAFGGFVTMASLYTWYQRRKAAVSLEEIQSEEFILSVLNNELGYKLFYQYCVSEFSTENILLWSELEQARRDNLSSSAFERKSMINHLKEMYLENNCEREVNIPALLKRRVDTLSKKDDFTSADAEEIYHSIYSCILANIADTMTRFTSTNEYNGFVTANNLKMELQSSFDT
jgi:hypothetical protein